jgi:hypothetical protein
MFNFTLKNNVNVGASIHDGLMIEKTNKIITNDEFLNICSRCVCGKTGYIVEIVEKPMVIDESLMEGDIETYNYKKSEFETNHFKIYILIRACGYVCCVLIDVGIHVYVCAVCIHVCVYDVY